MIGIDAPAKINLTLRVLDREASGYHTLETLFCAISLSDHVAVSACEAGVALRVNGAPPTADREDNLVVRAARRFALGTRNAQGVMVELTKRIPIAAGLGGGSSDAAATLLALQALRGGIATRQDLITWAAELGSDVPFFLSGSPLALAWARGERLLALPPLPSRPVLIAHPGIAMPTPEAFRRLAGSRSPDHRATPAVIRLEELLGWDALAELATNDFEAVAVEALPAVGDALAAIRDAGALIARLAGSGAAVFGIFPDAARRDSAEAAIAALGFTTWRADTLEAMPLPRPEQISLGRGGG